jgi:plastocyanin
MWPTSGGTLFVTAGLVPAMKTAALAALLLLTALLAGCGGPPAVKEIQIHIGYTDDRRAQYLEPKEIRVKQGDRVRFVITNDDVGTPDSFHDVAFVYPAYPGLTIEHEVLPGRTTKTCLPQSDPDTACDEDKSYFVASEKGSFKLWCEVGHLGQNADGTPKTRHEQMGMWGTLIVE